MNILAMDLGKNKTVVCFYDSNDGNYKFDRIKTTCKKIAITAVARKLLVRCWAMLRDGQPWRETGVEKVKEKGTA